MTKEDYINSIKLDGELWRYIFDTNDDYAVSSLGRVLSFKSKYPKLLTIVHQESRGRAYSHVCINSKKMRVHRLVAEAFVNNPDGHNEIDHINNDPQDNRACNLKWVSHKENMRNPHTRESERKYKLANPVKVDTTVFFNRHEDKMKSIAQIKDGKIVAVFKSLGEAERNGFKKVSISAVLHGRLKTYRGCSWMLLSDYNEQ